MKRKIMAVVLSVVLTGMLAACGGSGGGGGSEAAGSGGGSEAASASSGEAGGGEDIKIGATMFDLSDPYFVDIADGVKAAADDYGVEVIVDDPATDSQKQVNSLENFISSEVDGIICSAVEPESVEGTLAKAQERGIKVISVQAPCEHQDSIVLVLEYEYGFAGGVNCGNWINENYPDEEVEVGVIGAGLHTTGVNRTQGLVDGLASVCPKAKVVSEQDGEGLTEKAMSVAENMLQANPNMKAIMCFDDLAALGAYAAVNAVKSPEEQKAFGVFGLDAISEATDAIKEGGAYKGTVDIKPFEAGYTCMELCIKAIKGEEIPEEVVQDMVAVTQDNIDEY